MRMGLLVLVLALAGCNSAEDAALKAEAEYKIVSMGNSYLNAADLCEAADRAVNAWIKAENAEKYEDWRLTRAGACGLAHNR